MTYDLDLLTGLDILPLDRHAKIQVCTSVRSAGIARRTDRPDMGEKQGCPQEPAAPVFRPL